MAKKVLASLDISYGAFASPLSKQLREQGFKVPGRINYYQSLADSIVCLAVGGLLTDSMVHSARKKLHKELCVAVSK